MAFLERIRYYLLLIREEPRLLLDKMVQVTPYFIAQLAIGAIAGIIVKEVLNFIIILLYGIPFDVTLVLLVLLSISVPCLWKNPRALPGKARLWLLNILAGTDTFVANASLGYEGANIYVDRDKDIFVQKTSILVNQRYGIFALEGTCFYLEDLYIDNS